MSKKPPKHSDNAHYKHRVEVKIDIRPEATNTTFLLERARKYVAELRGQVTQVWLVYDKDDFPLDRFDTTQQAADEFTKNNDEPFNFLTRLYMQQGLLNRLMRSAYSDYFI
jgi:hypothetical protein